jgi:RND family efflux transporter MFP subunit
MKALRLGLTACGALLVSASCAGKAGSEWIVIRPQDLPLQVPTSGVLKAEAASRLVLPVLPDVWDFKIAGMAPENQPIRKGMPLLTLDTSSLSQELQRKVTERDKAAKEIEQEKLDLREKLLDLDKKLDEARAQDRKSSRKVEVPEELQSRVELDKARLDLELAQGEVRSLEGQRALEQELADAQLKLLSGRRDRAAASVADLEQGLRAMVVPAPRDGFVVYTPDYRGDKHKVGDRVTRWDQVLEVVDLDNLGAEATVDERDVERLQAGQKATLRLESDPQHEISARLLEIDAIVRQQSWDNPRKVAFLRLAFDRPDLERMRPGMRFRGEIQVGRIDGTLAIPMEAVAMGTGGPMALRGTGYSNRVEPVALKLGARSGNLVQVLAGLKEGDRVAARPEASENSMTNPISP